MLYPVRLFFKDRWIFIPTMVTVFLQLFTWWYTITRIHPSDQLLFVHYNIIFGVDQIGEWWKVWFIPFGGLVLAFVNSALAYLFYNRDKFIARFITTLTSLMQALIIIGSVLIISLNI